ncbi:hypothetical protein BKE38_03865 [Pseudoroseomonas deserti]|uniref:Major facilitator superfamily (MFS) profile domain-containing protein n=1 Tax=Teichococcus deserti TaxID=1817963 RepID=A0A1V2H6N3_9PROT|nr:hypothetical protein BKE38_03865 [Pseudoroseomonas deserti]
MARRRAALCAFFLLQGIAMASWVTRTPAIRDALGASVAEMGMVLLGLAVGSMTGILAAGRLVTLWGTRRLALLGLALIVASLAVMAAGVAAGWAPLVAAGLLCFGLGMGLAEIAVNVEGAEVERLTARPLLHALHGFFSLGTVAGALLGIGLTAVDFPVPWHLLLVMAGSIPVLLAYRDAIPARLGMAERRDAAPTTEAPKPESKLLLIGLVVLAMALAEGAANDWLPLLMVDEHGLSPTHGSLVFLGFAAAMTAGRFGGGAFLRRHGPAAVLRASALLAALGLALVIFATNPVLAGAAGLLWGLGAALGFPVALSAAGQSGPDPAARVRVVATAGYVAFLVGPPLLGFVGEEFGLRRAMLLVLALVLVAAVVAPAARPSALRR